MVSCGDEPGAAGMQATINGTEFATSNVTAYIDDDGMTIVGTDGSKTLTLNIDGAPQYGVNYLEDASTIQYVNGANVTTYLGTGEIFIDVLDYVNDEVEGTFYSEMSEDVYIYNGVFENITFIDSSSNDAARDTLTDTEDTEDPSVFEFQVSDGSSLSYFEQDTSYFVLYETDSINYITGQVIGTANSNDLTMSLTFPTTIATNTLIDLSTSTDIFITIEYNGTTYDVVTGGNITITENSTSEATVVCSSLSVTATDGDAETINILNGSFTIYYSSYTE